MAVEIKSNNKDTANDISDNKIDFICAASLLLADDALKIKPYKALAMDATNNIAQRAVFMADDAFSTRKTMLKVSS